MKIDPIILVYTTFPSVESAESVCGQLLSWRLIACANIRGPMTSLYWWKGKIEKATEIPAILKTQKSRLSTLFDRIKTLHPYEVPCMIALPVEKVNRDYELWLKAEMA